MAEQVFSQVRERYQGKRWFNGFARELLAEAPKPPHMLATGTVDEGRERWRFKGGELVAYFYYTESKKDPRHPWESVWLADDYDG